MHVNKLVHVCRCNGQSNHQLKALDAQRSLHLLCTCILYKCFSESMLNAHCVLAYLSVCVPSLCCRTLNLTCFLWFMLESTFY